MSESRRSRWGSKPPSQNNNHNSNYRTQQRPPPALTAPVTASTVSDDQALQALLASAEQRQEQKVQDQKQHKQRKRWDENDRNRGDGNRDRGDPNTNRNKKQKGNDSHNNDDNNYYQPQAKQERRKFNKEDEKNDTKYSWGDADADIGTTGTNNTSTTQEEGGEEAVQESHKPNFGLSGALANDDKTGNVYNGILLKFSEPPEARTPNTRWRFYVFKKAPTAAAAAATTAADATGKHGEGGEGDLLEVMHISKQSAYLFGREAKVADIPVHHPSLSKQHCVLQYRALVDKNVNNVEQTLRCKPYLMDLGSTNGTFINGVRIDDARYYELRKGDVITLGSSSREYVLLTENTTCADL